MKNEMNISLTLHVTQNFLCRQIVVLYQNTIEDLTRRPLARARYTRLFLRFEHVHIMYLVVDSTTKYVIFSRQAHVSRARGQNNGVGMPILRLQHEIKSFLGWLCHNIS